MVLVRPQGARDPRGRLDRDRGDRHADLRRAPKRPSGARRGAPADAVVWEEVEQRTRETSSSRRVFLAFMVLAALIAAVGIYLDSPILIVGAMVVGPEFGPIAGFCVALVQRAARSRVRSVVALAVGFPLAITARLPRDAGLQGDRPHRRTTFSARGPRARRHRSPAPTSSPSSSPSAPALPGCCRSRRAKSGALIGVLISVTTIPAAANIGVAAAYQDWRRWRGSAWPSSRSTSPRSWSPAPVVARHPARCSTAAAARRHRRRRRAPRRARPSRLHGLTVEPSDDQMSTLVADLARPPRR